VSSTTAGLKCYSCGGAITRRRNLGGSVTFSFGVFPLCKHCAADGRRGDVILGGPISDTPDGAES
jgi:hypothetical protein